MKNWLFGVLFVLIGAIASAEGTPESIREPEPKTIAMTLIGIGPRNTKIYRWEYNGKIYLVFINIHAYGTGLSVIEVKP